MFALIPAALVFGVLYCFGTNLKIAAFAAVLLLLGSGYYAWNDFRYQERVAALPIALAGAAGSIVSDPVQSSGNQTFYLKTNVGKLLIKTDADPAYV